MVMLLTFQIFKRGKNHGKKFPKLGQTSFRGIINCHNSLVIQGIYKWSFGTILLGDNYFLIIILLQSECIEKYQFELCSKYDIWISRTLSQGKVDMSQAFK